MYNVVCCMCYFCKYITLCCRCCLSVVRTWRKRWRNSRTASHHWSTDSGMCVPTASPPPYWWSRLPTRSVRLSNLGLTEQTVIGRFACYWLNSLSLGRSCFICWWFGEKESMLYMNLFVCFRAGPRRRSSYSWRTPTCWTRMTSMCSQSTRPWVM